MFIVVEPNQFIAAELVCATCMTRRTINDGIIEAEGHIIHSTDFPAYSDTVCSDTPLSVTLLAIPKPFVNKKCHSKRVKTRLE